MKYLYIEADGNDADYIGRLYKTDNEQLERFKQIFDNVRKDKNRSKDRDDHGVPLTEDYWDKDCNPGGIWEGVSDDIKEEFMELIPYTEFEGQCYMLIKIKILTLENDILNG